jgi:protein disulfide-isomerase A6
MARFLLSFVFLAALLAFASASSNVYELGPEDFDSVIDGSKPALVEFYAPWCGHCKNLAPVYEVLGNVFAHAKDKVVIAKVNADAHRELGSRYGVKGFPTLLWFPNGADGETEKYMGGRSEDDLISYIEKQTGVKAKRAPKPPSYVTVLTEANFDELVLSSSKDALVEFYAPWCGHCKHLAPEYEKLGAVYRNEPGVLIAKVDCDANSELCQRFEVGGYPTLKWFGKSDKTNPVPYEEGRDVASFVNYINGKTGITRQENGRLSSTAGRVAALDKLVAGYATAADQDAVVAKVKEVAETLTGDEAKSAKIYLRTLELIKTKLGYVASEKQRLNRMLESADLSATKLDEFTVRYNILGAFQ